MHVSHNLQEGQSDMALVSDEYSRFRKVSLFPTPMAWYAHETTATTADIGLHSKAFPGCTCDHT